jgi:hypothetical protein
MSNSTAGYPEFRRRLDDVLHQRNPAALRTFLIAEGQWTPDTATDPESAMWMMIATSPALAAQHEEARHWLLTHGHEAEAQAIFGARRTPGKQPSRGSKPPARPTGPSRGKAGASGVPGKSGPRRDNKRPHR